MDTNPNLSTILEVMTKGGESAEDIAGVVKTITEAASAKLYLEMMAVLTEDDLKLLNETQSQEEAEPLLRSLYAKRSQIAPEAIVNQFLAIFASAFVDKYNLDRASAMTQPVEPQAEPPQNPPPLV